MNFYSLKVILFVSMVSLNQMSFECFEKSFALNQTVEKYLKVEIPKLPFEKVELLIRELESYQNKIEHVYFDSTTRILTVHYISIGMDDILQIISKYTNDFNKLEGTEMP